MSKRKFPSTKAELVALAQAMINGLTNNSTDFPAPPVPSAAMQTKLDAFLAARNETLEKEVAYRAAVEAETNLQEDLTDSMKTDLRYAELVTNNNNIKLQEIGWSGRATPQPLQKPGIPRSFEVLDQGKGWVHFDWKDPKDGGKTAMYRLPRMDVGIVGGEWQGVGATVESEITVNNQPTGKEYIFTVVAVNAAGTSEQSTPLTVFI